MVRLARVIVPGVLCHVTQRGNRRQPIFLGLDDYRACPTRRSTVGVVTSAND
jgi:REP element-mobilizing transposase RayT